jgi:hypothetical protein
MLRAAPKAVNSSRQPARRAIPERNASGFNRRRGTPSAKKKPAAANKTRSRGRLGFEDASEDVSFRLRVDALPATFGRESFYFANTTSHTFRPTIASALAAIASHSRLCSHWANDQPLRVGSRRRGMIRGVLAL